MIGIGRAHPPRAIARPGGAQRQIRARLRVIAGAAGLRGRPADVMPEGPDT